jgi:hypothetical protein
MDAEQRRLAVRLWSGNPHCALQSKGWWGKNKNSNEIFGNTAATLTLKI